MPSEQKITHFTCSKNSNKCYLVHKCQNVVLFLIGTVSSVRACSHGKRHAAIYLFVLYKTGDDLSLVYKEHVSILLRVASRVNRPLISYLKVCYIPPYYSKVAKNSVYDNAIYGKLHSGTIHKMRQRIFERIFDVFIITIVSLWFTE